MTEITPPRWVLGGGRIHEQYFAEDYLKERNLLSYEGVFFNKEGRVRDESVLRKDIYDKICGYVSTSLSKKVSSLLEVIRMEAQVWQFPVREDVIHVANGTYDLLEGFSPRKEVCRYRLPARFDDSLPEPAQWLSFLDQLLEPEDIDTLQEYMGYCLIPVTYGQKMLTLVGNGGEGKSRIGVVMRAILGDNMSTGSLNKVEMNNFARADLEHLLLFVDDDLKMEALSQTNYLKAIITADVPMDLERKGKQSYQGQLYVRFLAFGNSCLQSLHDRSHGFFRRQIILKTKPLDPNRINDHTLGQKLIRERDAIFLWALTGLYRLIGNNYQFTISPQAAANLTQAMEQGNSIRPFLESEGYIRFDPYGSASSRALYACYREWAEDNACTPLAQRSFWTHLSENAQRLGLTYSNNIDIGCGKTARGFRGIRLCR